MLKNYKSDWIDYFAESGAGLPSGRPFIFKLTNKPFMGPLD